MHSLTECYEPYFNGYHWMLGPYAPMYQYGMPYMRGYQQMTSPIHKHISPPAKRSLKELSEDLSHLTQVCEPPSDKKSRMESEVADTTQHFIKKEIDSGSQDMNMKTGTKQDGINDP